MTDVPPKPVEGSVAPVEVVTLWKHPLVLLTTAIAAVPTILATLIQLKAMPQLAALPTNVTAWLSSAIAILTVAATILRALGLLGAPVITPTAAAKVIQTATISE